MRARTANTSGSGSWMALGRRTSKTMDATTSRTPAGVAATASPKWRCTVASTLVVMPQNGQGTPVIVFSGHSSGGWAGSAGRTAAATSISPPTFRRSLVSGSSRVCTPVNPWSRLRSAAARSGSIQQVGLLPDDAVVERLEAEPPGDVAADLTAREFGLVLVDQHRLARGLGHELHLTRALHGDEPEGGLVDRLADPQQAVVAEDDGLGVAQ